MATRASEGHTILLGLSGASNGGKTMLAKKLQDHFSPVTIIHQDDFYKADEEVPVSDNGRDKLWDMTEAINVEGLVNAVKEVAASTITAGAAAASNYGGGDDTLKPGGLKHLIVVEGTMLLNMRELRPLLDAAYFITLDFDTMKERRSQREYIGAYPDYPGYFEEHVWLSYMRDLKVACHTHQDGTVRMLDGAKSIPENLKTIEQRIRELLEQKSREQSIRKGGCPKSGQKHQNSVAFKAGRYGETRQLKLASSLPLAGICARCKDKIEWKRQYGKYKPLSAPRKCVECQEKKVKQAYYRLCQDCAEGKGVCAKCGAQEEIVMRFPPSESTRNREETELRRSLKMMTERERRKFLREQLQPSEKTTTVVSQSSSSDVETETEDADHMTTVTNHVTFAESAEQTTTPPSSSS